MVDSCLPDLPQEAGPPCKRHLNTNRVKNLTVIRPTGNISAEQARGLLRRFRDLNMGPCGIDVGSNARVTVEGCLSLDHPVERGVHYGLRESGGEERVLDIRWDENHLVIQLVAKRACTASSDEGFDVQLGCDGLGRISAPDLGARLHLRDSDAKDVEHFLRRIVRAAYAKAS